MALIDDIIARVEALPITDGVLTLTPQALASDTTSAFFTQVVQASELKVAGAKRSPGQGSIAISGVADFLSYKALNLLITFSTDDKGVVCAVEGAFSGNYGLPLVDWVKLRRAGVSVTLSQSYNIVQFGFFADLAINGATTAVIPIRISDAGGVWRFAIVDGATQPVTADELVALLSGNALAGFLPQPLVAALDGLVVSDLSARLDLANKLVEDFSLGLTVTNGWSNIVPGFGLAPGLELVLSLSNPTDSANRQTTGVVRGALLIGKTSVPVFAQATASAQPTSWLIGLDPDPAKYDPKIKGVMLPTLSDLFSLVSSTAAQSLPDGLRDMPAIVITQFMVGFTTSPGSLDTLTFAANTASKWTLIDGFLAIEQLGMELDVARGDGDALKIGGWVAGTFAVSDAVNVYLRVAKDPASGDWTLSGALPPKKTFNLTEIVAKLLSGHVALPSNAPQIVFDTANATAAPGKSFSLTAGSTTPWRLLDGLSVDGFTLAVGYANEAFAGSLKTTLTIAKVPVAIAATLDTSGGKGWTFKGASAPGAPIKIGDLIADLASKFKITAPGPLKSLTLNGIGVVYASGTGAFEFSCGGALAISDVSVDATLDVKLSKSGADYGVDLSGALTIATPTRKINFTLVEQKNSDGTLLVGTLASENTPVGLDDLTSALGFDAPIPSGVDIQLEDLGLLYRTSVDAKSSDPTSTIILTGLSKTYGNALFIIDKTTAGTTYLFGVDISISGSLSQIPLVGDKLPASADLQLKGLQLLIASGTLTAAAIGKYNTLLAALGADLPDQARWTLSEEDLGAGPSLVVDLSAGDQPHDLLLRMPTKEKTQHAAAVRSRTPALAATGAPIAPAQGATTGGAGPGAWLNLQKSLGPLFFNRVGVTYTAGSVDFVLDASMKISALTLSLIGVGVGSPISSFQPHFRIDGLGVDYESGPVILSGGLAALRDSNGDVSEYDGAVTLAAEEFELAALAAYSTRGETSMFAFAILEAPIGGPPFLFVTGVAAGFGYNRDLLVPSAADLPSFPLVQAVMGQSPFAGKTDPGNAVGVLSKYIPVRSGESWVALGIRFTTFELLKSFALVTAKFGGEIEFDLIGMSALSIPNDAASPIAYAELGLVGSYKVEEGSLAISGQLTPSSFVLDRDCHLTGGFAFYFWAKDSPSGAKAGDFVVTLGGYHPAFKRPDWYPVEPLLGANWQVSSDLTVKGGYYFALTPSAVMAGGELEAVWESGDLKAWFTAHADFLLCWKPFHYEAEIGISLGASYKLDLLFTSVTVTVHVGVELDFWGPSFAGRATVDLYVCSLTITFGDSSPNVQPIPWDEFKTTFLPTPRPPTSQQKTTAAAAVARPQTLAAGANGNPPSSDDPYCVTRVSAGMVKDLTPGKTSATDIDWVVNSELLELVTLGVIPSTDHELPDGVSKLGGDAAWSWNKSFGVGPVGIADGGLVSTHIVTLASIDKPAQIYPFDATPVLKNVPTAQWSKDVALSPGIATANQQPATIGGVLTGFSLRPTVIKPDQTSSIDLDPLQFTQNPTIVAFQWTTPNIPQSDAFKQAAAMTEFTTTLVNKDVSAARDALIKALAAQNVPDLANFTVDVAAMNKSASDVLLSAPVLSYLGEQRAVA